MNYRMYVDEVGNSDLESSDDPNHRFLSLTGVVLESAHVEAVVHPELEALKAEFFGSHPDDPVIFHRKEMLNALGPYLLLRDPVTRQRLDEALLEALDRWRYTVISVCLDKKRHKETYQTWRYDPYHYCLAMLLERYVFFLRRRGKRGDVMAESRGGREDRRLKESFERLYERGTDFVDPTQLGEALTSRQLKVKSKANNIAGLQVADLLAHPSRNEILAENDLLGRDLAPFATRVVALLQAKYDRVAGRIVGKKLQ